ncbi:carcinoembryonic antigen-related cell adhesion molecule 8-like [Pelobates cultripes]|uniref:Carcinoembryonic antigen-related cell adhesion molecule 8-like n=1 Tax=Pelobates cultripes TaxID=61616 RepID=A0AAD1T9H8_PELCU|nr:carcinoembryonic antigen-related cell adhesion molecule 8-like [Pelobates cultripes]
MQPISAISIQPIPQYPAVGQSVTLSVTGINGTVRQFTWYKGPNTNADNQILSYIPRANPPQTNGTQYLSRASGLPNASLLISDLVITDRGIYIVSVQTYTDAQQESVTLTVYKHVSKPVIKTSSYLVQENDTVTLTCEAENAVRILWGRSNGTLSSDDTLSSDNRKIFFSSIKPSDSGDYYCEAENAINKITSDIYTLTVNYGPENLSIIHSFETNNNSTFPLKCSVASFPIPIYRWIHNEKDMHVQQDILHMECPTKANYGNFTCMVENPVTKRTANVSIFVTFDMIESLPKCDAASSVGIIFGSILGIALIVTVIVVLCKKYLALIILIIQGSSTSTQDLHAKAMKNNNVEKNQHCNAEEEVYANANF